MTAIIKFILILLLDWPSHELNRDPVLRERVATYALDTGEQYHVDPTLILFWAWGESKLRMSAVGKDRPSIGYGQIHGKARKICKVVGYDVTKRRGNLYCMALLMALGREFCGEKRMLNWYARGSCKVSNRTRQKIQRRLKEWRKLKRHVID